MTQRSALRMTAHDVIAHATKNRLPLPKELRGPAFVTSHQGGSEPQKKARAGSRKLRKHRQPNDTEKRYGLVLEAMKRRGDIVYYGFEEISLRWGDLSYTPDFFVIRQLAENHTEAGGGPLIEAVYIEVKGGHKWEDSIIKWKAAKARFTWATFEMWQRLEGRWQQVG